MLMRGWRNRLMNTMIRLVLATTVLAFTVFAFTVLAFTGLAFTGLANQRPASRSIDGVWRLVEYQGGGNLGEASGLLLLQNGHFSYVYTMNQGRPQPDGRAHAGRYRVDGDALVFAVDWNLHYVDAKGIVDRDGTESKTRVVQDGKTMTITFGNGAVQRLERVGPPPTP
jgi:hypothetical protein